MRERIDLSICELEALLEIGGSLSLLVSLVCPVVLLLLPQHLAWRSIGATE